MRKRLQVLPIMCRPSLTRIELLLANASRRCDRGEEGFLLDVLPQRYHQQMPGGATASCPSTSSKFAQPLSRYAPRDTERRGST